MSAGRAVAIVPAYNEAERIGAVLSALKAVEEVAEVVVVDDGSTDATAEAAASHGVRVLRLPVNMGYGVALQTGFKYALRAGFDHAVQIDADGQHEAACIAELLAPVRAGETDLAVGSRFLNGGPPYPIGALRLGAIRFFAALTAAFIGQAVTDPTSGFQAMNRRVLTLYASEGYPCDFPDADVLMTAHYAGLRIVEVPVVMYASRKKTTMHSGLRMGYYLFKLLLSIMLARLSRGRIEREYRDACAAEGLRRPR